MTDKEILENARLLANFLGYIEKNDELFVEDSDEESFYKHKFFLKDAKFHYSYDWLMPVLDSIENKWEEVLITGNRNMTGGDHREYECEIITTGYQYITQAYVVSNNRIEAIYLACIDYIQKYNAGTLTQPTK